nr:hypothetical protein [Tanacetum cinerariifolium]
MNSYFATNLNDIEEERQPNSFDVDDESDVYFLQQAYQYHETLVGDENRPMLTRNPIYRDREGAEDRLMGDYFDEPCRMSHSVIMKCTAAICQLAYGTTPDAFDEYLQMSERTARDYLLNFNMCIIDLYMSKYLRKPTLEDVEKIYNQHLKRHGFSRMLESIDCMHWECKQCPVSWQGQYGANNDINVLDNSPLFDDLLEDKAIVALFMVFDVVVSLEKVAHVDRNLDAENIAKEGFREAITLLESLKSNALEQLSVLEEKDRKIKDLEANDQAVNFTSHSKRGKMLMAKCRTLQEESLDFI